MSDTEPVMQFYDVDGNRVDEGSPRAVVQYLSDDPARPDAKAITAAAEDKAIKAPAGDKATKAQAEAKAGPS